MKTKEKSINIDRDDYDDRFEEISRQITNKRTYLKNTGRHLRDKAFRYTIWQGCESACTVQRLCHLEIETRKYCIYCYLE